MTLEEAIKNHTVQSEGALHDIKYYTTLNDMEWLNDCKKEYEEFAEEHRQLAEWLKELKAYKDARVGCEYCKHNYREQHERPCSLCQHNFMDMFEREVNADEIQS